MKVSIEYKIIGSNKKYPEIAENVYVLDDWSEEQIKEWYEEKHHNICGIGVEVINIEKYGE